MPNCSRKTITDRLRVAAPASPAPAAFAAGVVYAQAQRVRTPWADIAIERYRPARRSIPVQRVRGTRIANDRSSPATTRIFSFVGVRARRSALLNCLRSFAQISLCDAQSAVPAKKYF
jgi:hypothetical protein